MEVRQSYPKDKAINGVMWKDSLQDLTQGFSPTRFFSPTLHVFILPGLICTCCIQAIIKLIQGFLGNIIVRYLLPVVVMCQLTTEGGGTWRVQYTYAWQRSLAGHSVSFTEMWFNQYQWYQVNCCSVMVYLLFSHCFCFVQGIFPSFIQA